MRILIHAIFWGLLWTFAIPAKAAPSCALIFADRPLEISVLVQKNKFVTGRDLAEYSQLLHPDFSVKLKKLTANQHWLDLGAGKAKAQIDYLRSFSDPSVAAQATAVVYKLDRWFQPPHFSHKLVIREGAFESQPVSSWRKADLVTDVFGVLSYTPHLQRALQMTLDLMNLQGELYIHTTTYTTGFKTAEGTLGLLRFLQSIDGLRAEGQFGIIKVTKEKESVRVPDLELLSFVDEAPPTRRFEVRGF